MANRRMISKSISVSEQVNKMSDFAVLLFTWLIPHSDDYGVIPGSSRKIKALVMPMRKQNADQIENALKEIQSAGLIWRYKYKDCEYLQFCKFEEHQEGLHRRTEPKNPLYTEVNADSENFREIPGNSPLIEPKRIEDKRIEDELEKVIFSYTENGDLVESITSFCEMRKSIKKPITVKALKMLLKKLNDIASSDLDKITVLNESTMNCWQGIFKAKTPINSRYQTNKAIGEGYNFL